MIIIGEKINGFIPSTLKAIESRDEAAIRDLALRQTEFGAAYLDVCAGTEAAVEREAMKWLIEVIQDTVDTPLCIDSSDIQVIIEMIPLAKRPGLINSISGEPGKYEALLPAIADTEWNVVVLTCDKDGIPSDPKVKYRIAAEVIEKAKGYGISPERLFIDPLVTTLATTPDALVNFNEAVKLIKADFPDVHITSGLSNISFGMPFRKAINTQFLALAMNAGMDSAIMAPTSPDMRATMYATDALIGNDVSGMKFLKAYRKGIIGPPKQPKA